MKAGLSPQRNEPYKLGIVGAQHFHVYGIVDRLASSVGPGIAIVGVTDEDPAVAESVAARYHTDAYPSATALYSQANPDLVVVAVRNNAKSAAIAEAIAAGIHTFVDKPVGLTLTDIDVIEEALLKNPSVRFAVSMAGGYGLEGRWLRDLIQSNVGQVTNMAVFNTFRWGVPPHVGIRPQWNFDSSQHGGIVIVDAIHAINSIRWLSDQEIVSVRGTTANRLVAPSESTFSDSVALEFTLSQGAAAAVQMNFYMPEGEAAHGRASTIISGLGGLVELRSTAAPASPGSAGLVFPDTEVVVTSSGEPTRRVAVPSYALTTIEQDFIAAVLDPDHRQIIPPDWALQSSRISVYTDSAVRSGAVVDVVAEGQASLSGGGGYAAPRR